MPFYFANNQPEEEVMQAGVTVRVDRQAALRSLAALMREKQRRFDAEKKSYPARLAKGKAQVSRELKLAATRITNPRTKADDARRILDAVDGDYRKRERLLPRAPELNLCSEEQYLKMFQMDARKVIPINSNSRLWAVLQSTCKPIQ